MIAERPANPLRGETEIEINGRTIKLRPSFESLVAAEQELGSLFAMVERAAEGDLKIAEMATLIWHCLDIQDRPDRDAVGSAIIKMGLVAATTPTRAVLAQVLQGQS